MNFNWYAIYTNSRSEAKVAKRLIDEGIEIFFPTIKEQKQWSDRKKIIEKPLFTSYIFVKISNIEYELVRRTPGVVNFVYFLGKPAIIREHEIEAIKEFLKKTTTSSIIFEPYDEVIISSGYLKGRKGIIKNVGKTKLRIIIKELKICMLAEIDKTSVEKA